MGSIEIVFDRGTLRLSVDAGDVSRPSSAWASVVWDERVQGWRAAAYRYADLVEGAASAGLSVEDGVATGWRPPSGQWRSADLRSYQEDALRAWLAHSSRGVVAIPTGGGKTRIALAAMARARGPTLVVCPTRALLEQWEREIRRAYDGPVGIVGDGVCRVEAVTVMTFESAYRRLDTLGDRFAMLVVDEVHHFAGGLRSEALEMCVAPMRLGLTATAPPLDSAGQHRLTDLVGRVVCEVRLGDLLGKHLAHLEVVRLFVGLDPDEAAEYERLRARFCELRRALLRSSPKLDWLTCVRVISRTSGGIAAIADYRRAVAIASFPRAKQGMTRELLSRHHEDRALVFTAATDDAYEVALQNLCPVITAETSRDEREEILARFRDGKYRAIISARVLNEGIDVPDARIAILVAGSLGAREHIQRVGRILRPSPGKRAIVYELVTIDTVDDGRARSRWRSIAAGEAARV